MGVRDLAMVRLIGEGFDRPEGVAYFNGCWYAGGEAGQIWRIGPDDTVVQVASVSGMVLGVALDKYMPVMREVVACGKSRHHIRSSFCRGR